MSSVFISTVLGTNSLNSDDVLLINKQTSFEVHFSIQIQCSDTDGTPNLFEAILLV